MIRLLLPWIVCACWLFAGRAVGQPTAPPLSLVWEAALDTNFSRDSYETAVARLFAAYEARTGQRLAPGEHRRAGLKLYTASGAGLRTPMPLVRAVVRALVQRGFDRNELFLLAQTYRELQLTGYVSWVWAEEPHFAGVPIFALDQMPNAIDSNWFYDSNLPSASAGQGILGPLTEEAEELSEEERRSYLPAPLLENQVDFWINLPMGTDSKALGVAGAIANATLWAITNHKRFQDNPNSAAVAAAEIAAIPEYQDPWVFSLLSLERYQYIGGSVFNANYTRQEPRLWMSASPVALDALLWERILPLKRQQDFPATKEVLPVLRFGEAVGLGPAETDQITIVPVH